MDVIFLKKFSKDLDKIKKPKDLQSILEVIKLVKQAQGFSEVPGTQKLKGYGDAFRIRSGDYRIGVFVCEVWWSSQELLTEKIFTKFFLD